MAIPSEADFSHCLELALKVTDIPEDFSNFVVSNAYVAGNLDAKERLIEKLGACLALVQEASYTKWHRLYGTSCYRWLETQREHERAFNLTFLGRRKGGLPSKAERSKESFLDKAKSWLEETEASNAESDATYGNKPTFRKATLESEIKRWIELEWRRHVNFSDTSWLVRLVFALREYYHRKDTAKKILELKKALFASIDSSLAAMQEAEALASKAQDIELLTRRREHIRLRSFHRAADELEQVRFLCRFPIDRNDSRAPEQLFVYRMWVANRASLGKTKAEAIQEFMGLEGFQHQYDLRTIERLCAKFPGRLRSRSNQNLPG